MLYDAPIPAYQVPTIVEPQGRSSRDHFPRCRASGGGQQTVYTCKGETVADPRSEFPDNRRGTGGPTLPAPRMRLYWVLLTRPTVDPEYGPMLETTIVDAQVAEGLVNGVGEVARLNTLVASEMPGWKIAGLSLADAPDVEF